MLAVTYTMYNGRDEHKTTWAAPNGQYRRLIDFVLVRRKFVRSVVKTRIFRGADIDSDHSLVVSEVRLKLKAPIKKKVERKLNAEALLGKDAHLYTASLEACIGGSFNGLPVEAASIEQEWTHFKEASTKAAVDVLGYAPRKKTQPWISEQTLRLVDSKQSAYKEW